MRTSVLATLAMLSAGPGASAARLRALVTVTGSDVRLSDLFSGLEPGQDCRLGDAPSPGGHLLIGPDQLAAIAAQFGVDWDGARAWQTVTIQRPGRLIDQHFVAEAVDAALRRQGMPPRETIIVRDWTPTEIDLDSDVAVRDVRLDLATDHYNADLVTSVHGEETGSWPLAGQIDEIVHAVEPDHVVNGGTTIDPSDLVQTDVPRRGDAGEIVDRVEDVVGMVARHALVPGRPIRSVDLEQPELVHRGSTVLMHLEGSDISLTAQGTAIDGGAVGERIRVSNPASGAILLAVVVGSDEVRVEPVGPVQRLALDTMAHTSDADLGPMSAR